MKEANVVGIGCFAKTKTLFRVFRKALENCILTRIEDIFPQPVWEPCNADLIRFVKFVISSGTKDPKRLDWQARNPAKITGFFLGFKKQTLNLSVFFLSEGHEPARYTLQLEKFTEIRKMRLN
jgi:hypothetical protein